MKKKITLLVSAMTALCLGLCLMAGCSSNNKEEKAESSDAATEEVSIDKLIVGFDQDYPPYGFLDEQGNPTGFDLDLATEVANRNGWEVELTPIAWDSKDALLGQGTINCIWNGFTMEGREDSYTFSDPYMLNEQVVVVKKGSGIESLADLSGKTVVTQVDSAALEVLENDEEGGQAALAATFKELGQESDYNTAFLKLESDQCDAVACDLSIAAYQMAAKPDTYVQLEEPLSSEHYAVGFKLGDEALAKKVTDTLREMNADGTVKSIADKYAESGLTYDNWILK